MKVLIVEDEFVSRTFLQEILAPYGSVHIAVNGSEAIEAVRIALDAKQPYDLVCMDLLMPILGGQHALTGIREQERKHNTPPSSVTKIILTTALQSDEEDGNTGRDVLKQMEDLCDGHLVKPIRKKGLIALLHQLNLIPPENEVSTCVS